MLRATHDILQKHNGVIDEESDCQRKRHQGQIVDGIVEREHHRDREQQRQGKCDRGNERIRGASKEDIDHQHHQNERDHECELHIVNGIDDALGPVEDWNEGDRSREARAYFGKERFYRVGNLDRICARLSRDGQHDDGAGRIKAAHPKCT